MLSSPQASVLLFIITLLAGLGKCRTDKDKHFYFYNEITGEVQWEDPGDVPWEDEHGQRYWLLAGGEITQEPPTSNAYVWLEQVCGGGAGGE